MKKLFFLFATLTIVFSAANAANIFEQRHATNSNPTNSSTLNIWRYGKFYVLSEAYGAGSFAQTKMYFKDGSCIGVYSHGDNGYDCDYTSYVTGHATYASMLAVVNELGVYHPQAHSYSQVGEGTIH